MCIRICGSKGEIEKKEPKHKTINLPSGSVGMAGLSFLSFRVVMALMALLLVGMIVAVVVVVVVVIVIVIVRGWHSGGSRVSDSTRGS